MIKVKDFTTLYLKLPKLIYFKGGLFIFVFLGEEGMFIIDVITGGIADNSGVRAGDRVVEINGENFESATHDQTVEKVSCVLT